MLGGHVSFPRTLGEGRHALVVFGLLLVGLGLGGCRLDTRPLLVPKLAWLAPPVPSPGLPPSQIAPADLEKLPPAPHPWRLALVLPSNSELLNLLALQRGFARAAARLGVQDAFFLSPQAALQSQANALCWVEPPPRIASFLQKAHAHKMLCLAAAANNSNTPPADGFVATDALSAGRMCGIAIMNLLPTGGNVLALGAASPLREGLISITTGLLNIEPATTPPTVFKKIDGVVCLSPALLSSLQTKRLSPSQKPLPLAVYGDTPAIRNLFLQNRCQGLVTPPSAQIGAALASFAVGLLENRLPLGEQVLLTSAGYLQPPPFK